MLSFDDFKTYVTENIADKLWEFDIEEIQNMKVVKKNGVILDALGIMEEGSNVAPNIYLEGFYADYMRNGDEEYELDEIVKAYKSIRVPDVINADIFMQRDYIFDNVYLTVVNYDKNCSMLKNVPYKRINDLALTVQCMVEQRDGEIASFRMKNANLAKAGITPAEIFERARENTLELFPPTLRSMRDAIEELSGEPLPEEMNEMPEIYVLSNTYGTNGATYMAYPDIVKEKLQEVGVTNAYILPSSVHEVIILPDDGNSDADILSDTGLNRSEKDMERGM